MSLLLRFCEWLDTHAWSTALHESLYMYPVVESIHVWALTLFVGFAAILDFRLLGIAFRQFPVSEVARRLLPWTIAGFIVMVTTGFLLFYAIPIRTYHSVWFRIKVVMLILAGINVFIFHSGIWLKVAEWDLSLPTPKKAKIAGAASLLLWAGIIFAGRMIAYNWFDCDRQPQPALINWAASCTEEHIGAYEAKLEADAQRARDNAAVKAAAEAAAAEAANPEGSDTESSDEPNEAPPQ